ncbi:MAG: hypothetical protein ABJN36_00560 [Cyclobacteriaceae bacterium]
MIEDENLHRLFTEEIYVLDEAEKAAPIAEKPAQEKVTAPVVEEPVNEAPEAPAPAKAEEPAPTMQKPAPVEIHDLIVLVLPMNAQDKELLHNLLKAIKKTEADIKLISSYSEFKDNCKKLLSFGYLNELKHQIDGSLETYKVMKLDDKEMLISAPLSALHNDKSAKGALWKCLQEMFLA